MDAHSSSASSSSSSSFESAAFLASSALASWVQDVEVDHAENQWLGKGNWRKTMGLENSDVRDVASQSQPPGSMSTWRCVVQKQCVFSIFGWLYSHLRTLSFSIFNPIANSKQIPTGSQPSNHHFPLESAASSSSKFGSLTGSFNWKKILYANACQCQIRNNILWMIPPQKPSA